MRPLTPYIAVAVLAIFLSILFATLHFLAPRTGHIIAKLTEGTTKDMEATGEVDFTRFMSWHQVCHALERRKGRLNFFLDLSVYGCIGGGLAVIIILATIFFHLDAPQWLSALLNKVVGLCLIVSLVGIIHPCFLIWHDHKSGQDLTTKSEGPV